MLPTHQEGNHHMRNFLVRDGGPILIARVQKVPYHVMIRIGLETIFTTLVNDVHIDGSHFGVGNVATTVSRERQPGEQEVDRSKTLVRKRC